MPRELKASGPTLYGSDGNELFTETNPINVKGAVEINNADGTPIQVAGAVEINNTDGTPIQVSGTVAVSSVPEVEVKNDTGNPLSIKGTNGAFTNRSLDVVIGASAVQAAAANSARKYLLISNGSPGHIWVNFSTPAVKGQPSMKIPYGTTIIFDTYVPTGYISVITDTTATGTLAVTVWEA